MFSRGRRWSVRPSGASRVPTADGSARLTSDKAHPLAARAARGVRAKTPWRPERILTIMLQMQGRFKVKRQVNSS